MMRSALTTRLFACSARVAAVIGLLAAFGGCASVLTPLGADKYDCNRKENPASPYCHSVKSVVDGTNGALPPSRFDTQLEMAEHDRLTGVAPPASAAGTSSSSASPHFERAPLPGAASAPGAAGVQGGGVTGLVRQIVFGNQNNEATQRSLEGRPVLRAPLVQRVWVKRFADGNNMLVASTYLYKEIMPPRWNGVAQGGFSGAQDGGATAFPHRPLTVAPATPAQSPSEHPTENSFAQPGSTTPSGERAPELAPVPASESGTKSMPN